MVLRMFEREAEREGKVQLQPHREAMRFDVRNIRRLVDPSPNAPQMIRLIRHPYGLMPGGMKRAEGFGRVRVEKRAPLRAEDAFKAALADHVLPTWPSPSEARPRREARPRLSGLDWSTWVTSGEVLA